MKDIKNKLLFVSLTFLLSSCSMILNFKSLPEPTGKYIIGTDLFTWEDTYRDEWFTKDKIDNRKIVVQIWYPASEKSDSLYPYMDFPDIRVESISESIGKSKNLIKPITKVKGNSYYKAKPISDKFPIILFSHGLGGHKTQNSINIEALVSSGYVVVAPDHTYDANITIFEDGSVSEYKSGLPVAELAKNPQLHSLSDDEAKAKIFWENRLPQLNIRAGDIKFIIDKLQTMKNHNLYSTLDFNKIGVFGHSFGGATSIVASWNDTRISACLNLDGWFEPIVNDIINTGLKIPFCYIGQENWEKVPMNYSKLDNFYKNCQSETYILKIKGTKHYDYADLPYFSKVGRMISSGKSVDEDFTIKISNLIVGFFDEYLKKINFDWTENIVDHYDTIIKFK